MAAQGPHRIRNFSQAMIYSIIVIAILGVVNFLANRYNKSVDSTANKRYSLSEQSAKIAREAPQDITIAYWNRPVEFPNARDLFDRYQNLSPKIKVEYNDIDQKIQQARAEGVTQRGQIFVKVGNKKEEAKSLTEEEVTGAMVRALKGGDRIACFVTGSGEGSPDDTTPAGFSGAKQLTEADNFKTQTVDLITTVKIPAECTVLVVGGPKRDLPTPAVLALKTHVENGGRALFMVDPPIKFGGGIDENIALVGMIEDWGIRLRKDVILDPRGVQVGLGPEYPVAGDYGDNPIVRDLKTQRVATVFRIARSIELAPNDKGMVEMLVATSDAATVKDDLSSPTISLGGNGAVRILAAAATLNKTGENPAGRIVVVGTSSLGSNDVLRLSGNRDLYLNMLNWLSADEDLISIRPKDPEDRRLNMNASQMTFLFWGSVVGLPVLMTLAGVSVWWRRR